MFSGSPDNPLSFSVPFNHVTYWVTGTNGARLKFLSLPCGWQNTKKGFGAAPSQAGEQVVGRSPGETPLERTWPVGSLRYSGYLANMSGTKQFYIPSDNSMFRLDQYGHLLIPIRFSALSCGPNSIQSHYNAAVYVFCTFYTFYPLFYCDF